MTNRRATCPAARRRIAAAALLSAAAAVLLLGCGKKAPPLPPLVGSKPRITDLDLRQEGSAVRARFAMPLRPGSETIDYRTRGIELWRREKAAAGEAPAAATAPPRPPSGPGSDEEASPGLPVGEFTKSAQLAQSISGDDLFDLLASPSPELVDRVPPELHGKELEYAIVLKTDVKSSGTVSELREITPRAPPPPPAGVAADLAEGAIRLSWTPAADADGKLLPVNVYRAEPDRPYSPAPLNAAPLAAPPYDDADAEPGATYRYVVRSVAGTTDPVIESDASAEVAATWADRFAPARPDGLRTFVDGPRVTLLWTPNDERDLLGYVVWRRAAGADWVRLTDAPVPSATYTDGTAPPALRLEYAVSALDRATPPNESPRSEPATAEIPSP